MNSYILKSVKYVLQSFVNAIFYIVFFELKNALLKHIFFFAGLLLSVYFDIWCFEA